MHIYTRVSNLVGIQGIEPRCPEGLQIYSLLQSPMLLDTHNLVRGERLELSRLSARASKTRMATITSPAHYSLVGLVGYDPTTIGLKVRCSTDWATVPLSTIGQHTTFTKPPLSNLWTPAIRLDSAGLAMCWPMVLDRRVELLLPGWKPGVLTNRRIEQNHIEA